MILSYAENKSKIDTATRLYLPELFNTDGSEQYVATQIKLDSRSLYLIIRELIAEKIRREFEVKELERVIVFNNLKYSNDINNINEKIKELEDQLFEFKFGRSRVKIMEQEGATNE